MVQVLPVLENQGWNKRVESVGLPCLDESSILSSSTTFCRRESYLRYLITAFHAAGQLHYVFNMMKNSVPLLCFLTAFLLSCSGGKKEVTEAELSAFGTYVYQLDTLLQEHIWYSRMGVSEDADSLLTYLRRELPRNGLDSTAFHISEIAEDLHIVHILAFDSVGQDINNVLNRLEGNLTNAYMDYVIGQRYGFMRPDRVFNHLDFKINSTEYARLFDYEVKAPQREEAEQMLTSDERLSYLMASTPTDAVYAALQARLATTTDTTERRTLAVNMERLRWLRQRPDARSRHIWVNIPAQQLWAVSDDSVLNMRICCGAVATKSPLLHSAISYIQVNPEWQIPQSIIKNEVSHHGGDSAYFARHHYYIIDRNSGDTLNPAKVTGASLQSGRLRVGQHGGPGNSLGRIVFRFPNNFSVYLHDTNSPGAFQRERRTLSHGCIRVQKPFDLAHYLLPNADEWFLDRLRISMDLKPTGERGIKYLKEHPDEPSPRRLLKHIDVNPHVPLFIDYFTAYPTPGSDSIAFWPDVYNYDRIIAREIPWK